MRVRLDPAAPLQIKTPEASAVKDTGIDYSDTPELSNEWFDRATHGLHIPSKKPVSLRLDDDVLAFFKAQGSRYQTRINAVLRAYVESQKQRLHLP